MKHENHDGTGIDRKLHNPIADRLVPLEPLDLSKVRSVDDLVRAMSKTAFTGRQIGEAADVLEAMARDKDCFVVMTLAGAMTVAKQGLVISELIERGIVNAIVSTGALMAHGLVEATGRSHFRYNPDVPDTELYEQGYNRVYDTLEPEQNLDDVERVMAEVLENWDHSEVMCSYKLNHAIGEFLSKRSKEQRGILKSAYEKGVPVFVPAFTDSELGLDVALHNRMREGSGRHKIRFDPFEDLEHFASTLLRQKRLGIFTIGGGVIAGIVVTLLVHLINNPLANNPNPLGRPSINIGAVLLLGVLVPVVQEVIKPLPAVFLPNRADFPETVDGLVFGVAAGLGFSLAETLINFSSTIASLPAHVEPGNWIYNLATIAVLQPLLQGSATGMIVATIWRQRLGKLGGREIGGIAMAVIAHVAFSGGGQLLAQTSVNPLLIIIWQAAVVGALLVYVRYLLHHALLQEAAHMGFAETVCPSCHMHIVASGFCPNCGMALTAAPSHIKRSRRERGEATPRTTRRG